MKNKVTILIKYIALRKRMMNAPYKYTEHQVFHTVRRLLHVDSEIQTSFVEWFKNGIEPKLKYADVSFNDLRKYKKLNEFNAFLFMDELKRNPDGALYMLSGNSATAVTLKPEELRPELREYVEQKMAEQHAEEEKGKKGHGLDENGTVTFNTK